jgi:hypothetical protein
MCVISGLTQTTANDYCNMAPGVKSAYFFDKATITDIDFHATDRDITLITTSVAGSLKPVYFDNDNAVISSELVGGYGTKQTQTLTIENVGLSVTLRNTIAEWLKCTCLGVIVVLENGQRLMLALEFDSTVATDDYSFKPKKNAGSYNSGTALDTDKTNKFITTFTFENMGNAPVLLAAATDLTGL